MSNQLEDLEIVVPRRQLYVHFQNGGLLATFHLFLLYNLKPDNGKMYVHQTFLSERYFHFQPIFVI